MNIVLASSSIYRKALMTRLRCNFTTYSPDINEDIGLESHEELVQTLSVEKAKKALQSHPEAVCIGCDTLATLGGKRLGKPGNYERAKAQLQAMSGQQVIFYTGIAVVHPSKDLILKKCIPTDVIFKNLSDSTIDYYLNIEKPYQSCGAFKSETLGTALISQCKSNDPTAIIGLPLITLCNMLEEVGIDLFKI